METAAEVGTPAALALLAFFAMAVVRLWPLARQRVTDQNRFEVAVATGSVLSTAGFIVAGQFVSVPGLEVPYYVVMVGAATLKARPPKPSTADVPVSEVRVGYIPPALRARPAR
jgi:hypothetical protein